MQPVLPTEIHCFPPCSSVMHRDDFTPVNPNSLMRRKFDEIGMHMEEKWVRNSSAVMQCWTAVQDR